MKRAFVFDVDGTLTPARGKIDREFEEWFFDFAQKNDVYLVSGSDRSKTQEQITLRVYNACLGVYQCNGNEHWKGSHRVKTTNWTVDYELEHFLTKRISESRYPMKTGRHIEKRTGMINFTTIGRNATKEQRADYFEWDKTARERELLAKHINKTFKDITASVGGEISIDIYATGNDKSKVAKELAESYDQIIFFGDRCDYGGNDFSIATMIKLTNTGIVNKVKNWEHTWELLKGY